MELSIHESADYVSGGYPYVFYGYRGKPALLKVLEKQYAIRRQKCCCTRSFQSSQAPS